MSELKQLLQKNFAYSDFRGQQEQILACVWKGQSVLALMPTGMGKSLCFQFPAKLRPGLVLVISPLIALMQDQVQKARDLGIAADYLASTVGREEREQRQKRLSQGNYQLFFVTPERFRKPEFLQAIESLTIQLMAVDEAHCISQWGHDFRPDYSRLGEIRKKLGNPPVLALTATATPQVQQDIMQHLDIVQAPENLIVGGIERANLSLNVLDVYGIDEKIRSIVALRHQQSGACIVYCSLIQTLKKISSQLQRLGMEHLIYHGELSPQDRKRSLRRFIEQESPLMIATPAFGLGIDKENVRLLIHAETPGSLESYFQEVGRAGRDGQPAQCYLLYDEDDISIQMEFLKWSHPEASFIAKVFDLIESRRAEVDQGGFDFLREQMVFKNRRDFRVEAAVSILERWGCLEKVDLPFAYQIVRRPEEEDFLAENSAELLKNQNRKLLEIVQWIRLQEGCRALAIYNYFGFSKEQPCGVCDLCLGPVQ